MVAAKQQQKHRQHSARFVPLAPGTGTSARYFLRVQSWNSENQRFALSRRLDWRFLRSLSA